MKVGETEGVQYIISRRGTEQVLYKGNTYTPNEKAELGRTFRTWKCSMYYKSKCKARITTRYVGDKEFIRPSYVEHSHQDMFPDPTL